MHGGCPRAVAHPRMGTVLHDRRVYLSGNRMNDNGEHSGQPERQNGESSHWFTPAIKHLKRLFVASFRSNCFKTQITHLKTVERTSLEVTASEFTPRFAL